MNHRQTKKAEKKAAVQELCDSIVASHNELPDAEQDAGYLRLIRFASKIRLLRRARRRR